YAAVQMFLVGIFELDRDLRELAVAMDELWTDRLIAVLCVGIVAFELLAGLVHAVQPQEQVGVMRARLELVGLRGDVMRQMGAGAVIVALFEASGRQAQMV